MKKLFFTILLSLASLTGLYAQQRLQYSQYLLNGFLVNPAVGGAEHYLDLKGGFSQQWAGFQGAPRSIYLSANKGLMGLTLADDIGITSLPVRGRAAVGPTTSFQSGPYQSISPTKFHLGVGGTLFSERTGPISYNGLSAAFSGHVHLTDQIRMSIGASFELLNYRLDPTAITFLEENDVAISSSTTSLFLPSINTGFALYSKRFFLTAATRQLLQNRIQVNPQNPVISGLEIHYLANLGYRFQLTDGIRLTPSAMIRFVQPAPPSLELSLRADLDDFLYFGGSYRHKDALVAMLGINLGNFIVNYSYDYTTSRLANVSSGTHSLTLGMRLSEIPRIGKQYFW